MDLKGGFQQSDVGPIPISWQERRLADIAVVGSGGTPSRAVPQYWNGTIPWITTSQIDFNEISEAEQYISVAGLRNSAAKVLPPGTLLMALYGQGKTRGKVGILTIAAATNQACASISLDASVSTDYVRYFLASRYEAIRSASNGGSQDNLSGQIVKGLHISLPPLSEQRAIAAALSDADALLGSIDRLIAKKRDLKKAATQQLLTGQTRLPGFAGRWTMTMLGAVGRWLSGGTPPKSNEDFWLGDIPWVSPKDMKVARLHDSIDHVGPSAIGNGTRLLPAGAILVVVRGMILAHSAPVARVERPVAFNQDIKGLVVNPDVDSNFILWWLVAHESLLLSTTNEATHGTKRIPTNELFKLSLGLPPLAEQATIAGAISDMDAELTALEQRRDKTRLLKQGMMQELLTGRTRLL